MHTRILVGVTAWLLGAATATGGSLLAVSLLGQGITGTGGLLLSPEGVNQALARESADASGGAAAPRDGSPSTAALGTSAPSPSATATPGHSPAPTGTGTPGTGTSGGTQGTGTDGSGTDGTGTPGAGTSGGPSSAATLLTSRGGDVVASCLAAGAYLNSWSPQSGYETGDVSRGPAQTAQVTFQSASGTVTMVVSCSSGVPSATTSSGSGWHDD